jgi:hypothetical protein
MPYLSSSDLDQGTFSMDVGCSIVKGRVEVREIARKKKCAYLDYHRQQVKKIQRKNLGNIFSHEEDPEFQKSRQEEEQKDMVEPQKHMVMVSAKGEPDAPISSAKDGILKVHKLIINPQAILDHPQGSDQVPKVDSHLNNLVGINY